MKINLINFLKGNYLLLAAIGSMIAYSGNAQHLDELHFGDTVSEFMHGITSFDMSKSEVYIGQSGLTARRFLPNTSNPYAGAYPGIYGGEIHFVMKVDSTKQNYFTVKLSGNETNSGRILLNVEGKELGSRHGGNEEVFWDATDAGVSLGAFFYRTAPIPRTLTDHKSSVVIRLRSSGNFFAYGSPFVYNTYQKNLTSNTCGVYRAYLHTNPAFALPADDVQGITPSYEAAPSKPVSNLAVIKANIITMLQNKVTQLLSGPDYIATTSVDYNEIEMLAVAYNQPYNTVAFHNAAVVGKIRKLIDNLVVNNNNGIQTAATIWGGAFGRPAYGAFLVYDSLKGLDSIVDLGGGAGLTRRQQWIGIFKASFNEGATNRKTITNQEMDNDLNVYGASLGLSKLDQVNYSQYPKIGLHLTLEACGIEQFTGQVINLNANNPTLGTPSTSDKGANYYWMTQKGTSHEPGWVSPDCYGNLGPILIEFWKMSQADTNVTAYGAGNGDKRIRDMAVKHNLTQSSFTYPWTIDGNKAILSEGAICWRNVYIPGKEFYGQAVVAGIANDPNSIGFMKQMAADGMFNFDTEEDPRTAAMQYLPSALDTIMASTSTKKIPSTPGEPDYISADEENGMIAIKNGNERVYVSLYNRAYSDNRLAKAHHITATTERKIEFKPDTSEYYSSGQYLVRGPSVAGDYSGEAPDTPISGYAGQKEYYPSYNRTTAYNTDRCISEFYQARFGKYMIAMNTTTDFTKTINFPVDMVGKSGYDIGNGNIATIPATLSVAPRTTRVFFVASSGDAPGLLPDTRPKPSGVIKTEMADSIAFIENFAIQDSNITKVSTTNIAGKYKYDLFNTLIQQIAAAKYAYRDTLASQGDVDTSKNRMMAAYYALIGNKYSYSTNTLAPGIYFIKIPHTDSFYTSNMTPIPLFDTVMVNKNLQRWNISYDNGRYKILNVSNNGYLNENAKFGVNSYDASWNTMNIIGNGATYAIQKTQNAGNGYWYLSGTNILTQDGNSNRTIPLVFPFELVLDIYAGLDAAIDSAKLLYDSSQSTTAQEIGKYPVASKSAFNQIIQYAVGINDSLTAIEAVNAVLDSLDAAIMQYKQSMYFLKNQFAPGKYYLKYGSLFYTANLLSAYGFSSRISSADSTTQIWDIKLASLTDSTFWVQNLNTKNYWNEWARAIKTENQLAGDGNWDRFNFYFNSSKYAIQKMALGQTNQYFNGAISNGMATNINTFADPGYYIFELQPVVSGQSITFNYLPVRKVGDSAITLTATASSGLPVTYSSSDTSVAKIIDGELFIQKSGMTILTAKQNGAIFYAPAVPVSKNLTVLPVNLQVLYEDGDNGQLTNNTIKPYLQIVSQDSVSYPYKELTVRYWFTSENYAGINTWIDYAQLGNNKIKMQYVQLEKPRSGAFGYIKYSFDTTAGILASGTNSGVIQSRLANKDWSVLNEEDDYSYANNSSYKPNNHLTLYRNGVLIAGEEPVIVQPLLQMTATTENKGGGANAIGTYLKIANEGNIPIDYSDVSARYWFTKDGSSNLNFYMDYWKLGNANIRTQFYPLSPVLNNADTYLEFKINAALGSLYPLSNTDNIQYHFAKSDWSVFNQLNDYSYLSPAAMTVNDHVTLYYKGDLVFGKEPGGSDMVSNSTAIKSIKASQDTALNNAGTSPFTIYPNPAKDHFYISVYGADISKNKNMIITLLNSDGKAVTRKVVNGYAGGVIAFTLEKPLANGVYMVMINQDLAGKLLIIQ